MSYICGNGRFCKVFGYDRLFYIGENSIIRHHSRRRVPWAVGSYMGGNLNISHHSSALIICEKSSFVKFFFLTKSVRFSRLVFGLKQIEEPTPITNFRSFRVQQGIRRRTLLSGCPKAEKT